MCRPMKKRNLTLLILINIVVGSAGADELGSATESAAIQSLLQSVAQQQESMAIQTEQLERQEQQISEQSERLQSMEDQLRQTAERLRDPEIPIEAEPAGQPGYLLIPGTGSSMKLGGYAKMSIVQSFDPVGSTDRFAPGTIPVPEDPNGLENQANLNARQSRLNVDMCRDSTIGPLRAFIEGSIAVAVQLQIAAKYFF